MCMHVTTSDSVKSPKAATLLHLKRECGSSMSIKSLQMVRVLILGDAISKHESGQPYGSRMQWFWYEVAIGLGSADFGVMVAWSRL